MMGKIKNTILAIGLLFSISSLAWSDSFEQFFTSNTAGDDPGQPDTLYFVCQTQNSGQALVQLRLKTDVNSPNDSLQGFYLPLIITADKPGVVLDTQVATSYAGTAVESWLSKVIIVYYPDNVAYGDPSHFPMKLLVSAADILRPNTVLLGTGDHLLANLHFSATERTTICLDTTSQGIGINNLMEFVTRIATGYQPQWKAGCCKFSGTIPTLTGWGLIIFAVLILVGMFVIIRRRRLHSNTA